MGLEFAQASFGEPYVRVVSLEPVALCFCQTEHQKTLVKKVCERGDGNGEVIGEMFRSMFADATYKYADGWFKMTLCGYSTGLGHGVVLCSGFMQHLDADSYGEFFKTMFEQNPDLIENKTERLRFDYVCLDFSDAQRKGFQIGYGKVVLARRGTATTSSKTALEVAEDNKVLNHLKGCEFHLPQCDPGGGRFGVYEDG
mmetsp:Transcript_11642/g.26593  ORF Transcript_11642/g.26593 Transcript_11642/m.26593 type:complete len:199 (-) Transcript_11642:86-682(-)